MHRVRQYLHEKLLLDYTVPLEYDALDNDSFEAMLFLLQFLGFARSVADHALDLDFPPLWRYIRLSPRNPFSRRQLLFLGWLYRVVVASLVVLFRLWVAGVLRDEMGGFRETLELSMS